MAQLDRLLVLGVLQRTVLALAAGAEAAFTEVEPCDDFGDFVTGCGDTIDSVFTSLILGTIPGPDWPWLVLVNTLQLAIYVPLLIFSVYRAFRGQSDD